MHITVQLSELVFALLVVIGGTKMKLGPLNVKQGAKIFERVIIAVPTDDVTTLE
jgi:hypothetical protein